MKSSHENLLITEVEKPLKYTFVKSINKIKAVNINSQKFSHILCKKYFNNFLNISLEELVFSSFKNKIHKTNFI